MQQSPFFLFSAVFRRPGVFCTPKLPFPLMDDTIFWVKKTKNPANDKLLGKQVEIYQ